MNIQELIEKIGNLDKLYGEKFYVSLDDVLDLVKQLDEAGKVKIPQFVADWIEVAKSVYSLSGAMTYGGPGVNKWLENEDNQRTFALAWFDGYEVEKEKKYRVKMKGIDTNFNFLNRHRNEDYWIFSSKDKNTLYQTHHTRKELEDAGFGWVFDCEEIEIEEVTE